MDEGDLTVNGRYRQPGPVIATNRSQTSLLQLTASILTYNRRRHKIVDHRTKLSRKEDKRNGFSEAKSRKGKRRHMISHVNKKHVASLQQPVRLRD
jgi:hypothetical protein